jgi:hypothetical protein
MPAARRGTVHRIVHLEAATDALAMNMRGAAATPTSLRIGAAFDHNRRYSETETADCQRVFATVPAYMYGCWRHLLRGGSSLQHVFRPCSAHIRCTHNAVHCQVQSRSSAWMRLGGLIGLTLLPRQVPLPCCRLCCLICVAHRDGRRRCGFPGASIVVWRLVGCRRLATGLAMPFVCCSGADGGIWLPLHRCSCVCCNG